MPDIATRTCTPNKRGLRGDSREKSSLPNRLNPTEKEGFRRLLYYLQFKAVLDSKDIEAIKAEQKTLKEDYEQHLNKHKETLNKLRESEKTILSDHRDELKEIMRGESVWLSFKAWVWGIIVFELLLVVVGVVVYFSAKAKFT